MNQRNFHLYFPNRLLILLLPALTWISLSCEQEPEPLTTNSVIRGTAELFKAPPGTLNNIRAVASGPYGTKTCLVGDDNNYKFTGMGNGTYYLEFGQEGYGTVRQYGIQVFGNDTVDAGSVHLFKKIGEYVIPLFTRAYSDVKPGLQISRICIETVRPVSDYDNGMPVILFFDDQNHVSWQQYTTSYPAWEYMDEPGYGQAPVIYVDAYNLPFRSGTEVFVIGYVCNCDEYVFGYIDTYLGRVIYSTLDPDRHSNMVSFVMP